jgi:transposase
MRRIAADLGVSQETLRGWVNQDRIDRGEGKPGELTTAEKQELVRLRRENAQLRMEREILKARSLFRQKRRPGESLPVHRRGEGRVHGAAAVPSVGRVDLGVLRLVPA